MDVNLDACTLVSEDENESDNSMPTFFDSFIEDDTSEFSDDEMLTAFRYDEQTYIEEYQTGIIDESDAQNSDNSLQRKASRGRPGSFRKTENCNRNVRSKEKKMPLALSLLCAYMCCTSVCLGQIPEEELAIAREHFIQKSCTEKSRWVFEWILTHTRGDDNQTTFIIGGKEVCLKAWTACIGLPLSTYYSVKKRFSDGIKVINGPGNVTGKMGMKSLYALSWLEDFANKYGDKMPDSKKLHLPCCLRKKGIYAMMLDEAKNSGETEVVSQTHFGKLWREYMSHIQIPKRSRFTVCDDCHKINEELQRTKDKLKRANLLKIRDEHLTQQNMERKKYYKHSRKARMNPDSYISIILDAMDQDKTSLPHLLLTPKALSNAWLLRVNLMGAIVHGMGSYGFFDTFQWAHGSSYTISILCHVLMLTTNLPDVLYLQLDNCPGQNKNRYMLGFLAALVEADIFKKIKLSFLMVGHTHEDIDQLFSRFSVWLQQKTVMNLDSLIEGFEKCYSPKPVGIRTSMIYNWGDWLKINPIINHSRPHVFKIVKEDGKAVIYYKKWTTDKEWIKSLGDHILKEPHTGSITSIPPSTTKIDDKVKHDIRSIFRFYNNAEEQRWWDKFFDTLTEEEDSEPVVEDIIKALQEKKRKQPKTAPSTENEEYLRERLKIPQTNSSIPPVIIGKKTRAEHKQDQENQEPQSETITVGDMVLLYLDKYRHEWPQVAKVLNLGEDVFEIQWFKGSKTTNWSPATVRVKGCKGGKVIPFTEHVPPSSIWLSGFQLTTSGLLPKYVREKLDIEWAKKFN